MKGRELIEIIEEEGLENFDIEVEFKKTVGADGWGNMGKTTKYVVKSLKFSEIKNGKLVLSGNYY